MTAPAPAPVAAPDDAPARRLYRSAEGRLLGGVARGLAGHLGLPVVWVRAALVALGLANGLGVLLYAAFWCVVPLGTGGVDHSPRTGPRGRPGRRQVAMALVLLAVLVFLGVNSRFGQTGVYLWPLVVIGVGVALVWRQADDARRAHWAAAARRPRLVPLARAAAGVALVVAGGTAVVVMQGSISTVGPVLQASLAVVAGIALLAGPFLVRLTQDLSEERLMRIRAQERAEVAAHVHDSVLHTLTLIQRNAENPREVARLARAQERDLREWLHKPRDEAAPGGGPAEPQTFAGAVKAAAAGVEDHHGVPVEVVCVGDCPLEEVLSAQVQAAREAMVNAAKYGGEGGPVQVFAEVEGRTVFVSVRDRGPGFDPEAVPADRMGVRQSIVGRMERHGGTARIRSAPGEGTEVELEMERAGQP